MIQSQTVSGVVNVDFVSGISGYSYYILEALQYYFTANDNFSLFVFFSSNAGASWSAFSYAQFMQSNETDHPTFRALGVASSVQGPYINGIQGTTGHNIIVPAYGIMKIFGLGSSSIVKQTTFVGSDLSNDAINYEQLLGVSSTNLTTVVNGIRIAVDSGPTIPFSGTFRLFGVV